MPIPYFDPFDVDDVATFDEDELHQQYSESDPLDFNEAECDAESTFEVEYNFEQKKRDDEIIHTAMLRNERAVSSITMPWDRGYAAQIFNPRDDSRSWPYQRVSLGRADFIQDVVHRQTTAISGPVRHVTKPVLPFALRKLRVTQLQADPDVLRQRAINIWRLIIEDDLFVSATGLTLQQLCMDLSMEPQIQSTLNDVFAPKSTATLYKRGREILAYVQWFRSGNLSGSPLLFDESQVYSYIQYLKSQRVGPTRANSFVQSVRFTVSMLGCKVQSLDTVVSARVKGAAYNMYILKRPLKQALPLTVEEVRRLELVALEGPNHHDQVAAGFMLFCILSSARVADAQNITNIRIDAFETTCILECDTLRHKTATTCEKKTTFLPYLCVGSIFQSSSWAKAWVKARTDAEFNINEWALPAPDFNGSWLSRRATTGEITQWLRDILITSGLDDERVQSLTSHGFKTTILSWAAKYGMDLETRRILGHHVDPQAKSALTYSRDALIAAHIQVADMLSVIGAGGFNPDMTRAERMHRHLNPSNSESTAEFSSSSNHLTDRQDHDQVHNVTDESSSEDDVASVPGAVDEAPKLWSILNPSSAVAPLSGSDVKYVQHTLSGCMHIQHPSLEGNLLCGRLITFNFREALKHDTINWTICGQCSKAHQG